MAWAHLLAWPVAAVLIAGDLRRAVGALALAWMHKTDGGAA